MAELPELIDVARLEEGRLARALPEIADEWRPIGGGVAARAAPGSWLNYGVNVGMHGPVERGEVEEITRWYEAHGTEPRFEVCPYSHGSLWKALESLRFSVRLFETVLFRTTAEEFKPRHPLGPGIRLQIIDPRDPAQVDAYTRIIVPQFYEEGQTPGEQDYEIASRAVRHPRTICIGAFADERIVGGGGMDVTGECAALFGAAVAPEYRRRGIQQALVAERLRIARERHARVATIGCRTGQEPSGTERNARRMGFQVAYTKAHVTRPGPGLAAAMG
jgi:GNAT superfamily N-acetyltransferase